MTTHGARLQNETESGKKKCRRRRTWFVHPILSLWRSLFLNLHLSPSLFLSLPPALARLSVPSSAHCTPAHCMAPVVSTTLKARRRGRKEGRKEGRQEGRKWNGKDKFGLRCLISRQLVGGRASCGRAWAFGDYARRGALPPFPPSP